MVDYIHFNTWLIRACLIVSLMVGTVSSAWAVPAKPVTIHHTQKDGTELTLTLVGDEYLHYYVTPNGEKMTLGADGDYYLMADFAQQEQEAQKFRAAVNADRMSRLPRIMENGPKRAPGKFLSTAKGDRHVLVVLVQFSDVKFQPGHTAETFRAMYNDGENSLKAYFESASYGQFRPIFDVIGPVTLDNTQAHYGAPTATGNWTRDQRIGTMIMSALKDKMVPNINIYINYADYDWNGDKKIEQVVIIYAGGSQAQGAGDNCIWPHQWTLSGAYGQSLNVLQNGTTYNIDQYCCSSELCGTSSTQLDGFGCIAHEFSHCLGLPDLYSTQESYYPSTGYYDLMDRGCYNGAYHSAPCGYSAYERSAMEWLDLEELNAATTVQNMPSLEAQNATHRAFKVINPDNSNQYYVLENRQNGKWFQYNNQSTAAHGLYITRINYSSSVWTGNTVNAIQSNQHLVLEAAGNNYPTSLFTTYSLGNVAESNGTISFNFAGGSLSNIIEGSDSGDDIDPDPETPIGGTGLYYPHIAYLSKGVNSFVAPALTRESDGALTYTSSNPAVATVNTTTGAVTLVGVGRTVITVTQAATASFESATASYLLEVR